MENSTPVKTRKHRRTQAEIEAARGKAASDVVNALPVSLFQSFCDGLEPGVFEYLKAKLNQPRKP